MSKATLTAEAHPDGRLVTIDCPHGTTWAAYANAPGCPQITDTFAARLALAKHHDQEGCRCTRHLRRRYGVQS